MCERPECGGRLPMDRDYCAQHKPGIVPVKVAPPVLAPGSLTYWSSLDAARALRVPRTALVVELPEFERVDVCQRIAAGVYHVEGARAGYSGPPFAQSAIYDARPAAHVDVGGRAAVYEDLEYVLAERRA